MFHFCGWREAWPSKAASLGLEVEVTPTTRERLGQIDSGGGDELRQI